MKKETKQTKQTNQKSSTPVLLEAQDIINGARQKDYGHPLDNMNRTCNIFFHMTGIALTPIEACKFMQALKLSRERNRHNRDNLVDSAGYIGIEDIIRAEIDRRINARRAEKAKTSVAVCSHKDHMVYECKGNVRYCDECGAVWFLEGKKYILQPHNKKF
jgi:hypothetical protein